jgi:hypothetical protein
MKPPACYRMFDVTVPNLLAILSRHRYPTRTARFGVALVSTGRFTRLVQHSLLPILHFDRDHCLTFVV